VLAGVDSKVVAQLEKTGLINAIGIENVFMHSDHIGESILASWDKAEKWVADPSKRPVAEIVLGAQVEPEAESQA
jgi:hypothetical protein